MNKFLLLAWLWIFTCSVTVSAQETNPFNDSLALSFLHKLYPNDSIGYRVDTINGIKKLGHNFYAYPSFHLNLNDSTTIELVNFGVYYSEGGWYIAIIDSHKNDKNFLFLGTKTLEEDLAQLTNYFNSKQKILKREYKLEILDLYLRCANGQLQTPTYIH